jgi:hypothetical protein
MDKAMVLAEIDRYASPPQIADGEITIRDYQQHAGVTYAIAHGRLEKLVTHGVLSRRIVSIDGKNCVAYQMKEENGQQDCNVPALRE